MPLAYSNQRFVDLPQIKDLWTYIGKRENDIWIWTAVFDKEFKFFEIGKRDENTFWNFYYQIPLAKEFKQMDTKFIGI